MVYEREKHDDKRHDDKKKDECTCNIKIEDSIVILICGDVDIDKLKESLEAITGVKGNKKG